MFEFGKIVLIPFPFTDLTSAKVRPALIISAKNKNTKDVIVAFISSNTSSKLGLVVEKTSQNGLKINSVIRFDKIATLNKKLILGEIGEISRDFLQKNKESFLKVFGF